MKRFFAVLLTIITLFSFAACDVTLPGTSSGNNKIPAETFITIKESPDKYSWYIKNYVGKNCAAFGDTSYNGYRYDNYGEGVIKLIYIAEDNSFVDPEDKDTLKNYVVIAQSVAPNTELKLTFAKYADGTESDYAVDKQNIEEIELYVRRIAEPSDSSD